MISPLGWKIRDRAIGDLALRSYSGKNRSVRNHRLRLDPIVIVVGTIGDLAFRIDFTGDIAAIVIEIGGFITKLIFDGLLTASGIVGHFHSFTIDIDNLLQATFSLDSSTLYHIDRLFLPSYY
jgi:hypothetical protein